MMNNYINWLLYSSTALSISYILFFGSIFWLGLEYVLWFFKRKKQMNSSILFICNIVFILLLGIVGSGMQVMTDINEGKHAIPFLYGLFTMPIMTIVITIGAFQKLNKLRSYIREPE